MVLANLSIYDTWRNIKSVYNNNKTDLSEESYSIPDIQYYFKCIIKKYETISDNPNAKFYTNNIKNRIVFKIKTSYKLDLLSSETMKLLGSAEKDVDQKKDGDDIPKLKPVQVVLVHCNLVNNNY